MIEHHSPLSMHELMREFYARSIMLTTLGLGVYLYLATRGLIAPLNALGLAPATFVVSLLIALAALVPMALILRWSLTAAYSRVYRPGPLMLATAGLPGAVFTAWTLDVNAGVPLAASIPIGCALTVIGTWCVSRYARDYHSMHVRRPIWLDDSAQARELIEECRSELCNAALDATERAATEANLAGGLATLATLTDQDDGLPEAYEILARSLAVDAGPDGNVLGVYLVAARLVEAMHVRARRTGELEDYEEALTLLLDAAEKCEPGSSYVMPRALVIHAAHLEELAAAVALEGDLERASRLHDEAVDDLVCVLEGVSHRRAMHAVAAIELAALVQADGDLDWAIELCRDGLRRLRRRPHQERHFGYIVLADLLVARWATDHPQAERALADATRLCRSLTRHRTTRAQAIGRLPGLLRMAGADRSAIARAYRDAFDEHSRLADDAAVEIAAEWSAWAIEDATADEVAEAHWRWLRAVAADIRRRTMRAHKEHRMSRVQGLATETATWLLRAGRTRDAAVALEVGRAMLLTERMQRDREGVEQRLAGGGHTDLSLRWRAAQEQIARADRDGFDASRAEPATMLVGGRRFRQRFASADHRALTDHERLLREISRLPGFDDVDVEPDYEDLAAAAGEGPLVYLAAAEQVGHALIVTADASEPLVVWLADLCAADVVAHVQRLVRCGSPHELSDALAAQAPWLWDVLMEPIVTRLVPHSLVTLIPLGPLSMLALHIAGMTPGSDGIWSDRTDGIVFRYAPNARVLRRAQAHAAALDGEGLHVLTVNVPAARGESPLHATVTESAGVAARFGPQRCERPSTPDRASVLSALDRCAIWHFACHGLHDPLDPLESRLALSDGPLTLRAIFARPAGRRRLAVLSACRTAMPNEGLLDEVIGFPSALLQAGVAGVVSSQVDVGDRAAMLLVLRFFDEVAQGTSPPRALARAQVWLSSATNGEIHRNLPDALPLPAGRTEDELAYWEGLREFSEPHCWAPFSYCGA